MTPNERLELDLLAGKALADQVELVERAVMHRDGAAALAVADLDPETKQVTQLAFQRFQISINRSSRGPLRSSADIVPRSGAYLLGKMLGLADRQVAVDNLVGQCFGIGSCQYGSRVAHTDIASQEH